jgi:thioredoxin-dependent peroxiredoxin
MESHRKFREKYKLKFDLIADIDKEILQAYDAWGEKSMYGKKYMGVLRTTFVIDEDGIIQKIFEKVETKDHTNQIIKNLNI